MKEISYPIDTNSCLTKNKLSSISELATDVNNNDDETNDNKIISEDTSGEVDNFKRKLSDLNEEDIHHENKKVSITEKIDSGFCVFENTKNSEKSSFGRGEIAINSSPPELLLKGTFGETNCFSSYTTNNECVKVEKAEKIQEEFLEGPVEQVDLVLDSSTTCSILPLSLNSKPVELTACKEKNTGKYEPCKDKLKGVDQLKDTIQLETGTHLASLAHLSVLPSTTSTLPHHVYERTFSSGHYVNRIKSHLPKQSIFPDPTGIKKLSGQTRPLSVRRQPLQRSESHEQQRMRPQVKTQPKLDYTEIKLVRHPRNPTVPVLRPEVRGHICKQVNYYQRDDKPVGKGTFGEVYKGRDPVTKREFALKKVLMENEVEGFPITALREIKIMRFINHENILHLESVCQSEASDFNRNRGSIYMVFEWMDHDLAGLLKRDDIMFSVAQTKGYFKQLLEGLHHLHRHNILHRDLKSSNILINNNGILKIADFGLARKFDSKQQEQGLTNRVVTLWYRPPELLLGQKHYDTKIDMWGSGCILGELFLKEELLKGSDELDQLRRISKLCGTISEENWPGVSKLPQFHIFKFPDEQRTVRERFKDLSEEAVDLIDKLLCLDPAKRLSAFDALDHDFFWTDPEPLLPAQMPKYSSSHEMIIRNRNHQKALLMAARTGQTAHAGHSPKPHQQFAPRAGTYQGHHHQSHPHSNIHTHTRNSQQQGHRQFYYKTGHSKTSQTSHQPFHKQPLSHFDAGAQGQLTKTYRQRGSFQIDHSQPPFVPNTSQASQHFRQHNIKKNFYHNYYVHRQQSQHAHHQPRHRPSEHPHK